MSRLYFRSKALDIHKPLPIYLSTDSLDLNDCSIINRDVPEMPTGMEKEEELETHFQLALEAQRNVTDPVHSISKQSVIPTPNFSLSNPETRPHSEVRSVKTSVHSYYLKYDMFEEIGNRPLSEYDIDSEDEAWIQSHKTSVSTSKFEAIFTALERGMEDNITSEKILDSFRQDTPGILIDTIHKYWLKKSDKLKSKIVSEIVPAGNANQDNPYTAFRKRNDRMVTRRNRKYDEQNYEKLYQFKKTFEQLSRLMELICSREKMKNKLIHVLHRQFSHRNSLQDWNGNTIKSVLEHLNIADTHIQTYFQSNLSSFNSIRSSEEKRNKDSSIEAHSSNRQITLKNSVQHSSAMRRSSKLSGSDSLLQSTTTNDSPDGRFTFVPNNISVYLQPTASIRPKLETSTTKSLSDLKRLQIFSALKRSRKFFNSNPEFSPFFRKQQYKNNPFFESHLNNSDQFLQSEFRLH